jgi:hypothetical protein
MPICCFPTNKYTYNTTDRLQHYIAGLTKFFEYNDILLENQVDIYIFDNTIGKNDRLPQELLDIIPSNVNVINDHANIYGGLNKGAGLIESWLYLKDIIRQYDYLIHFEPRQLLLQYDFIDSFLKNKSNVFTYGSDKKHFNTGLFCIDCNILDYFIHSIHLNTMIHNCLSIEYMLFDFFTINHIPYTTKDKMNLLWFGFGLHTPYSW